MNKLADLKRRLAQNTTEAANGCHLWVGASRGNGYGAIKLNGKVIDTHRAAYLVHVGAIPSGMCVLHTCDHRACVNPAHLVLGTYSQNYLDAIAKGRAIPFRPTRSTPLTKAEIRTIRDHYNGGVSVKEISRKFDLPLTSAARLLGLTK